MRGWSKTVLCVGIGLVAAGCPKGKPDYQQGRKAENLAGLDQTDRLIVHHKVLAAFEHPDQRFSQDQNPVDPVQREGVRLARDRHEKGADDRHRDRQLEGEPSPLPHHRADPDHAADAPDHALNHVEPDASAGNLGDLVLG